MRVKIAIFSGLLLMICGAARAATDAVGCPDTIVVNQKLTAPITGWKTGLDETPHRLANITFYDGPPEDQASLVNDQTTKAPGRETATWRFAASTGRLIWASCSYAGTSVTLAKSLPPKTSQCSVTVNLKQRVAGSPVIEQVSCK